MYELPNSNHRSSKNNIEMIYSFRKIFSIFTYTVSGTGIFLSLIILFFIVNIGIFIFLFIYF